MFALVDNPGDLGLSLFLFWKFSRFFNDSYTAVESVIFATAAAVRLDESIEGEDQVNVDRLAFHR